MESLELFCGRTNDYSGLDNLHKLGKLKRLKVNDRVTDHLLNHMQFGVFEDLEELEAGLSFRGASMESIREMKRITPNLKKLQISFASSNTIDALLGTLENLESLKIPRSYWKISENVYPKIGHLDFTNYRNSFKLDIEPIPKAFPNLEYLRIQSWMIEVTESSFLKLLSRLKRLKTLEMKIQTETNYELNTDWVLRCFKKYGKGLEETEIRLENYYGMIIKIVKKPGRRFRVSKY